MEIRTTGDWVQYSPPVRDGVVYVAGHVGRRSEDPRSRRGIPGMCCGSQKRPIRSTMSSLRRSRTARSTRRAGLASCMSLDASTGELLWSRDIGMGADSPPTVVGGIVYLTAVNSANALDESNGELIWSYSTGRFPARDFPALVADDVYYFSPDDHIYSLDTGTGEVLWSYRVDGMINTAPVTAKGLVYVGSESGRFLRSGHRRRTHLESGANDGGVEVANRGRRRPSMPSPATVLLRALRAATGEEIWQLRKGYFDGIPSYTVSGGVVYVGSLDGGVYAFTAPPGTTK